MQVLVKAIGMAMMCFAAILIFSPAILRKIANYVKEGAHMSSVALIRFITGALLISSAFSCAHEGVVLAVGIILAFSGIVTVSLGVSKATEIIDLVLSKPDALLRGIACIPMVFGVVLIVAA